MFIVEKLEQQHKNDEIRMEIIRSVMEIYDQKSLKSILCFASVLHKNEFMQHPYTVTDVASMMDTDELEGAINYLMKQDKKLIWVRQLYDAFSERLNCIRACSKEEQ